MILSTNIVNASYSYKELYTYIFKRWGHHRYKVKMCPEVHMAATVNFHNVGNCISDGCNRAPILSNSYQYCLLSGLLIAMCAEKDTFQQFYDGCERASQACSHEEVDLVYDYFDGSLFREKYGDLLRNWHSNSELLVFVVGSTDGFELFRWHEGECAAGHSCLRYSTMNLTVVSRRVMSCSRHSLLATTTESFSTPSHTPT